MSFIENKCYPRKVFQESSFNFSKKIEIPLRAFEEYICLMNEKIMPSIVENIENENSSNQIKSEGYYVNLELRKLHYSSIFIFICAFFEKKMQCFCLIVEQNSEFKIEATEDKDGENIPSHICRYKKYLENEAIINFKNSKEIKKTWSNIINFNNLRNVLVHSNGHTSNNEEKIESIRKIEGVVVGEGDNPKICIQELQVFNDLIDSIRILLEHIYYEENK